MLEILQGMLTQDKDAQVVANCMSVLQQVDYAPARPKTPAFWLLQILLSLFLR